MSTISLARSLQRWITGTTRRLSDDRAGVGAIEFAIIFPILLSLYITCFELTIGFSVYKRATRAAGTIADLVSSQSSVDKASLAEMKDVAAAVFVPHNVKGMTLRISGIKIVDKKRATIAWSWDQSGGKPYGAGSAADIPANLLESTDFLIHAEVAVPHDLLMFLPSLSSKLSTITIRRDYYFAKRETDDIVCRDC